MFTLSHLFTQKPSAQSAACFAAVSACLSQDCVKHKHNIGCTDCVKHSENRDTTDFDGCGGGGGGGGSTTTTPPPSIYHSHQNQLCRDFRCFVAKSVESQYTRFGCQPFGLEMVLVSKMTN